MLSDWLSENLLSLINFLGLESLFIAANQLYEVHPFGQVAHIVVIAFCGFKGFDFFAQQVENNDLTDRIGMILHGNVICYGVWENSKFREVGILSAEHHSGNKEKEDK